MPYGKGTYGSKVGRPPKKVKKKKKVVKTKVKARKADTLPPMIIPLPPKPKRKIPKDVTKRTSPKRKVPMRKSAAERERKVQFAKEHPLMQRKQTPPSLPTRLRGRPALDTSMLLAPLGLGGIGAKGVKAARKATKKPKRKGLSAGAAAALGASTVGGPLGAIGGALAGALSGRPSKANLRKAAKKAKKKRY